MSRRRKTLTTEKKLDIFATDEGTKAAFKDMAPDELATHLIDAPPKADLLMAQNVLEALWEMPPRRAQLATAIALKNPGLPLERRAMLGAILGSALRREGATRAKEATMALDEATKANLELSSIDPTWAERIQGAIDYEKRQVLPYVGRIAEASELNYAAAKAALQKLAPNTPTEERFKILFQIARIGRMQAVEAAYALMVGAEDPWEQTIALREANALLKGLERLIETNGPSHEKYDFWKIQIQLDRIKLTWIAGKGGDFLENLQWISERMEEDEHLKTAYDVSFHVATAMNALTSGVEEVYTDAIFLASSVALDEKIGIEWRADAFAVAVALADKRGEERRALGLCDQLFLMIKNTGWRSAAVGKATEIHLTLRPKAKGEDLYRWLYLAAE